MKWFSILKEQKTITDLGVDFELPEKVESKNPDDNCCERAKDFLRSHLIVSNHLKYLNMPCSELSKHIDNSADEMNYFPNHLLNDKQIATNEETIEIYKKAQRVWIECLYSDW